MRTQPAIFKVGISSVHIFNLALAWLSCLHTVCVVLGCAVIRVCVFVQAFPSIFVFGYLRASRDVSFALFLARVLARPRSLTVQLCCHAAG